MALGTSFQVALFALTKLISISRSAPVTIAIVLALLADNLRRALITIFASLLVQRKESCRTFVTLLRP